MYERDIGREMDLKILGVLGNGDEDLTLLDWRELVDVRKNGKKERPFFLPSRFNADGTHLNRKIVPLVARAYWAAKGE